MISINNNDVETLASILRKAIRIQVEMVYDIAVSLMVKNKMVWEDDYAVSNMYDSIREEGIAR